MRENTRGKIARMLMEEVVVLRMTDESLEELKKQVAIMTENFIIEQIDCEIIMEMMTCNLDNLSDYECYYK